VANVPATATWPGLARLFAEAGVVEAVHFHALGTGAPLAPWPSLDSYVQQTVLPAPPSGTHTAAAAAALVDAGDGRPVHAYVVFADARGAAAALQLRQAERHVLLPADEDQRPAPEPRPEAGPDDAAGLTGRRAWPRASSQAHSGPRTSGQRRGDTRSRRHTRMRVGAQAADVQGICDCLSFSLSL
jgi:hypothetical protein